MKAEQHSKSNVDGGFCKAMVDGKDKRIGIKFCKSMADGKQTLISPKEVIEDLRGIDEEDVEDEAEDGASVEEESEGGGKWRVVVEKNQRKRENKKTAKEALKEEDRKFESMLDENQEGIMAERRRGIVT